MTKHYEKAKEKRSFIAKDLKINSYSDIQPYVEDLKKRKLENLDDFQHFLQNKSELEAVLEEDAAWRYIKMSCYTDNDAYNERYTDFVKNIEPQIKKDFNLLDKKTYESPHFNQLADEKYFVLKRSLANRLDLFRDENVHLFSELQVEEQKYGQITGVMSITHEDKELTLQQASNYLKDTNRNLREEIYHKIMARRKEDAAKLDELLDKLIAKRTEVAKNCGFENYRDYRYKELGRFDYNASDVDLFHKSIEEHVTPIAKLLDNERKEQLGYSSLKPWDMDVDPQLKPALKPFANTSELVKKTIVCLEKVNPKFAGFLAKMEKEGYLDLDSRKGKAPGGYNYPLYESNIPFIFMNATNNLRDLETMVHEGGHAIHSFLSEGLELVQFKELSSEIAELASMSMELISMEHWDVFFENDADLKRAKKSQLEGVLKVLPWIATIDKFQNWLYLNPNHSHAERHTAWAEIYDGFSSQTADYNGLEDDKKLMWQKQLHIYQFPFYYIEYGIAQLGAIAMWKQYKENPAKAIKNYEKALTLGYSLPIPEIFKAAGLEFSFKPEYVKELMSFVWEAYRKI